MQLTETNPPPDLAHQCAALKVAYWLCMRAGDSAIAVSLMTRLHEIEDGY
jgi:hypothetical protein